MMIFYIILNLIKLNIELINSQRDKFKDELKRVNFAPFLKYMVAAF